MRGPLWPKENKNLKILNILIIAIVLLLSIAAGLAKVMQAPQEMEFLQSFGLSSALIMVFGLVQISAGVLIIPARTRMPGAVMAALAFAVSAVLIFISGNLIFGLASVLPAALACLVVYQSASIKQGA